ncbi:MAG TPA: hypothetical protein VK184_07560 [Nostocaceae cyanobacterium]|nr:hypothetical protein [Nostocaceae cyanobacterium]
MKFQLGVDDARHTMNISFQLFLTLETGKILILNLVLNIMKRPKSDLTILPRFTIAV